MKPTQEKTEEDKDKEFALKQSQVNAVSQFVRAGKDYDRAEAKYRETRLQVKAVVPPASRFVVKVDGVMYICTTDAHMDLSVNPIEELY